MSEPWLYLFISSRNDISTISDYHRLFTIIWTLSRVIVVTAYSIDGFFYFWRRVF